MASFDYDLIVVGAGAGGAVVAARASEDPRIRVLLVESGPDYPNVESLPEDLRNVNHGSFFDHDWKLRYTPSPTSRTPAMPRGRVMGGSSAVNTAIALRGVPSDYDEWASLGNPLWSWEKVLPAFKRLETDLDFGESAIHGGSGPLPIRRHHARGAGAVPGGIPRCLRRARLPGLRRPQRPGADRLRPAPDEQARHAAHQHRDRLSRPGARPAEPDDPCRHGCPARRVQGRRRDRRRSAALRGAIESITARQVVLACGAIHTPAVLVRSGIGPRDVLDRLGVGVVRELSGVGQHMQDHPAIGPTMVPKPGVADFDQPVIQTTLRYTATDSSDFNDMQLEPLSFMHIPGGTLLLGLASCVFKSYSYGHLEFESADIDAKPLPKMQYFADERDYLKIVDGLHRGMALCETKAIASVSDGVRRPTKAELADPGAARNVGAPELRHRRPPVVHGAHGAGRR